MTGLFGGTFNPPHIGHMILAEQSLHALALDRIIFIPSGTPPHKNSDLLPAEMRYKLTVLAACLNPHFEVSDYEIKKSSVSYTIDTLRHFNNLFHGEMVFLLGMDSLQDLKGWKESELILNTFTLGVWRRPGAKAPEDLAGSPGIRLIEAPELPVSSSLIRKNIREGIPYRYLLPERVYDYISAMELYL